MGDLLSILKPGPRLPVVLQSEVTECGLACLAMIASFYGREINLRGLRHEFPISSRGLNLKQLMEISSKLGFTCRPLRLEMSDLSALKTPCILHWDLNHFVVLKEVRGHKVTIHDPALGQRVLDIQEVSKHFTGIALEPSPLADFQAPPMKEALPIKSLFGKVVGLKRSLLQALLLTLVLLLFSIAAPIFVQLILDEVLVTSDDHLLKLIGLAIISVVIFQSIVEVLRGLLLVRLGGLFVFQFGSNLFHRILRLPLGFFERRHIGDIVSRFQSMHEIKRFLTQGVITGLIDGLMSIAMLALMLVYSAKLTLIVVVAVLIYVLVRITTYRIYRDLIELTIVAQAKENTSFMESVRSIQSIKLYGGENDRQNIWQNLFGQVVGNGAKADRFRVMFSVASQFLFGLEKAAILYFGAKAVLNQDMSAGMLVAFISYRSQFSDRITSLVEKAIDFKMLGLHLERLGDFALHKIDEEASGELELAELNGSLTVKNLRFRYDPQSSYLFKDLNMEIEAGEHIAIVGPSGCGKSTLLKVLLGLLPPEDGQIEVDGVDLATRRQSYRRQVATVMQDDQLISGSISENIAFFDTSPDMARIVDCARRAAIHNDIMLMPMQYNTFVGDMGSALSGGQKQRILLARALYRQPKILFLDEATSHLDTESELRINQSIQELDVTRIVVAHRRETILAADKILVLANGKLIPMEVDEYMHERV